MESVHIENAAPAGRAGPLARYGARAFSLPDVWVDVIIAILCIFPLLLTAHIPMEDLPNHLARQYVLRDWAHSPDLQRYYYIQWALVPNLALELFFLTVRWALPLDFAMRLFCILTVLLLFLGTRSVNRAFSDGTSRLYRAVPVICWGGPLQEGFLNYCFGVGLSLVLFGGWLRIRNKSLAVRVAFLLAAGFGLMLCHLAAFGLFAIAAGVTELVDRDRWRRLAPPVLCLCLVFAVFLLLSPTAGTAGDTPIHFSDLRDKIRSVAAITYYTAPVAEGALLLGILGGLLAALLTRTVRWHRVGLGVVGVMTLIWLVTPSYAMGTTFIDYRLPWAISFFALAALLPGASRWARPWTAWLCLLIAARVAMLATFWLRWEPIIAGMDQALSRLPVGAKIMVIAGERGPSHAFRDPDVTHVAAYAVARRQAFYPSMFASIAGQVLYFQPHYRDLFLAADYQHHYPSSLTSLAPDYDYVLVLVPELAKVGPNLPLKLEDSGREFEIFKVTKPG